MQKGKPILIGIIQGHLLLPETLMDHPSTTHLMLEVTGNKTDMVPPGLVGASRFADSHHIPFSNFLLRSF